MTATTTYEIVIKGRATARFLRPMLDDFAVEDTAGRVTRLVGVVRDAAHLHGIVAHLTSVGVELISIGLLIPAAPRTITSTSTSNETSNQS